MTQAAPEVRPLGPDDGDRLRSFSCYSIAQSWSSELEQLIREVVPAELASGRGLALGTFSSRQLSGVVTFTTPDVMVGHSWCSILAVDLAYRHRGLVRVLKEAAMDAAYALGARAMTSLVHPENQAMLHVNSTYGNVKRLANDVRYEAAGSDVMYSCMIKLPWERLR